MFFLHNVVYVAKKPTENKLTKNIYLGVWFRVKE